MKPLAETWNSLPRIDREAIAAEAGAQHRAGWQWHEFLPAMQAELIAADARLRPAPEVLPPLKRLRLATKDPATMPPGEIERELERIDAASGLLTERFIALGRGHERPSDLYRVPAGTDPLADYYRALSDRRSALTNEIELRAGPGHSGRFPYSRKRGDFGPRRRPAKPDTDMSTKPNPQILGYEGSDSFVVHKVTGPWKGTVSAYFDGRGVLQDAEHFPGGFGSRGRPVRRDGPMWQDLNRRGRAWSTMVERRPKANPGPSRPIPNLGSTSTEVLNAALAYPRAGYELVFQTVFDGEYHLHADGIHKSIWRGTIPLIGPKVSEDFLRQRIQRGEVSIFVQSPGKRPHYSLEIHRATGQPKPNGLRRRLKHTLLRAKRALSTPRVRDVARAMVARGELVRGPGGLKANPPASALRRQYGEPIKVWRKDGFQLKLYETREPTGMLGRTLLAYEFSDRGKTIFTGDRYKPAPAYADDSLAAVYGLLGFLSLREGDTDDEYFKDYTPEQIAWRDSGRAEELSMIVHDGEERLNRTKRNPSMKTNPARKAGPEPGPATHPYRLVFRAGGFGSQVRAYRTPSAARTALAGLYRDAVKKQYYFYGYIVNAASGQTIAEKRHDTSRASAHLPMKTNPADKITNRHLVFVRYHGATDTRGSRISVTSYRFPGDRISFPYDSAESPSSFSQAEAVLTRLGYTIACSGEAPKGYIIGLDQFIPLKQAVKRSRRGLTSGVLPRHLTSDDEAKLNPGRRTKRAKRNPCTGCSRSSCSCGGCKRNPGPAHYIAFAGKGGRAFVRFKAGDRLRLVRSIGDASSLSLSRARQVMAALARRYGAGFSLVPAG